MLQEFAVDPATLNSLQSYRYITEKFGVEHGRLIALFPRHWRERVIQACAECKPMEKHRIVESLTRIHTKLLDRKRPYAKAPTWLLNAEAEHLRDSFHAIIAVANPRNLPYVKVSEELSEDDECFVAVREQVIPRTVQAMAACVERLFQGSKEILFVDPHFDPDRRRFTSTLKQFVRIATQNGLRECRIEYHLGSDCPRALFHKNCEDFLLGLLPRNVTVTFIRWEQIDRGDHLHPRYILTDIGGLHVDSGLDEGDPGETTDIRLLTKRLYVQRWNDYQTSASTTKGLSDEEKNNYRTKFRLVNKTQVIGRRTVLAI